MVATRHPRDPCNYMDHYSFTDPGGMEGWVGLVGVLIADALPTKWSHVNHGSGVDQGKSASYKPTFLPLSHAANQSDPSTDCDALWLKLRGITQGCALSTRWPTTFRGSNSPKTTKKGAWLGNSSKLSSLFEWNFYTRMELPNTQRGWF